MDEVLQHITTPSLGLGFMPALVVVVILFRWSLSWRNGIYALARMTLQLILVGYVLAFIFETDRMAIVLGVLTVMLLVAGWIALSPLRYKSKTRLARASVAILVGGGIPLIVVTQIVLSLDPWYLPRYLIPLAGMALSNAMNAVSLGAERLETELARGVSYHEARNAAMTTSLIPITNSLLATGLVSFPGMMTGQILAGVSPLLAARYQMVIMAMVFGAAGLATATYLRLAQQESIDQMEE